MRPAYVVAALVAGGSEADAVVVFSALLVTAAVMGVSQAANRERQRRELARLSRSDPLTGCLNRRGFTERFEAELSDYVRHDGRPLGLIVIDLDDFKLVNDSQGHAAGDALLCRVAAALTADLRPSDVLGRLGGDEFAVLLPEAGPGELRAAAERLEQRSRPGVAASIGVAPCPPTARPRRRCTTPPTPTSTTPSSAAPVAASSDRYAPSARAMTICWTSSVPSPMVRIFASRYMRQTGYSSM